ncbi:E3 ubiquitin-protein ligase RNF8 [Geodia barretti]|uniref:E3 ubiquitin-protein ligase CHFR n=1 Tax=Geodia barretti TaxID=519541 RepID=A0AA35XK26_GEOBA|nr:E3 ubiquitin-protein ligase RNF8 [Geodia barretti]
MTTATEHHKQGQGSVARCKSSEAHDAWNVPEFIPLEPSAGPLTIGRASQADIFIRSSKHPSMVSRVHASLWFNESTSQWNITDLESVNGVYINGKTKIKPSTPVPLENGNKICFGSPIPGNQLRYTLVTSCGDPHMLLRAGAGEERETAKIPGAPSESGTIANKEAEPSPQLVKIEPHTSNSPQEIIYEKTEQPSPSEVLRRSAKKPRLEAKEDESSAPGVALSSQNTGSIDENDSQRDNATKSFHSSGEVVETHEQDTDSTAPSGSQSQENPTDDNTQLISQQPLPLVPQPPPSTPSYLVSPLSLLETPASAIDELFSDGAVEKDFDEIVSDAIFGDDGSMLTSTAGPSSEALVGTTSREGGHIDGASLQIRAARDDMQKEKQKLLSSIEALKSELASKEKLLVEKSEAEKEVEETKKKSEGVIDSMQEEFTCAICQELFIEAHTLTCAHSFCNKCIKQWMKSKRECPVCRKAVSADPVRSLVLDNAIDKMVEKMGPAAVEERRKLKDSRTSAGTLSTSGLLNAPRQSNASGSSGFGGVSGFGGFSGSGGGVSGTQSGSSGLGSGNQSGGGGTSGSSGGGHSSTGGSGNSGGSRRRGGGGSGGRSGGRRRGGGGGGGGGVTIDIVGRADGHTNITTTTVYYGA